MTFIPPPRVLVVDDYLENARVLAHLLRIFGFEALLAHDGESAVARAAEVVPDAVLLDLSLPDISGYEVARRLRADHATRNTLIVAITGFTPDDAPQTDDANPFDHHLVKPVDPSMLRDLLWNAFSEAAAPAP
jgi:CheY-like chemotaxis protein